MGEHNYREDVKIDKFALDEELLQHPAKYMMYAELAADAVFARDKAKEKLEFIEAELDSECRAHWDALCPGIKITNDGITAWIRQQPVRREAVNDLNVATRNMNLMTAAKEAFQHRKKSLEGLKELYLAGYFSRPVIPEESRYKAEQAREAASSEALGANPRLAGRRRPAPPPPSETAKPLPGAEQG